MLIKKEFHFYAAHRNELLKGKCNNIHGHRYGVTCMFGTRRESASKHVTIEFAQFEVIEDYFRDVWDHSMLIHTSDPVHQYVANMNFKIVRMKRPTSVENVCFQIFGDIIRMEFPLEVLEVKETDTSTIIYSFTDYERDCEFFDAVVEEDHHECVYNARGICNECGKTKYQRRSEQAAAKRAANQRDDLHS